MNATPSFFQVSQNGGRERLITFSTIMECLFRHQHSRHIPAENNSAQFITFMEKLLMNSPSPIARPRRSRSRGGLRDVLRQPLLRILLLHLLLRTLKLKDARK